MADFNYVAKMIKPEGKIVYEYNPLYNYRPKHKNGDTIQDGEVHDMITENSEEYGFTPYWNEGGYCKVIDWR